jgi:alkylation response protein AidB-like acyl-CoA dehydrogenase
VDFDLNEEQAMLRDLVARFIADNYDLADRVRYRREPEGFLPANWQALGELGLLLMPFPEEIGGLGGGRTEIAIVMEGLGRGLCVEPYLSDLLLAGGLIQLAGTDAQRESWLPRIMAGQARVALAHVEHQARYNPLHVQCTARADGDIAEINGTKTFVMSPEGVDAFIVTAREQGSADDRDGLTLWLVAADAPGIDRRNYRLSDGSLAAEIVFRGVQGERMDGGAEHLLAIIDEIRIAACAEMVGIMSTLFDSTIEHIKTRKQFGQPLGSFQAIQHRMADLYVLLEQSRSQMLRASLLPAEGSGPSACVAAAKSFLSAAAVKLGEECIQFHGGMGTSDELSIGHGHKRILVLATLFGDAESELARYAKLVA